jgi:tight adherence protein C
MIPEFLLPSNSFSMALVAGVAMFVSLLSVARALTPAHDVSSRARSHARRREQLRASFLTSESRPRQRRMGPVRQLVQLLKLHRSEDARKAAELLSQAGWRSADATNVFLAVRLASPLILALLAYAAAPAFVEQPSGATRLFISVAGMLAGAHFPKVLLRNVIQRRQQKIFKALPDALDLLVICAEAGLSLDAAIRRVGVEIGEGAPELSDEFGLTAVELSFLPDRREALGNLARRLPMPQIQSMVNTLAQTEKYGTPIANALRVLSQDFRVARMMKAEQRAARLPATMTVPMMTFILPPLFVVLVGPAIVGVLSMSL